MWTVTKQNTTVGNWLEKHSKLNAPNSRVLPGIHDEFQFVMDSLAPARPVLADLHLRSNSFRRFPSGSSRVKGFGLRILHLLAARNELDQKETPTGREQAEEAEIFSFFLPEGLCYLCLLLLKIRQRLCCLG